MPLALPLSTLSRQELYDMEEDEDLSPSQRLKLEAEIEKQEIKSHKIHEMKNKKEVDVAYQALQKAEKAGQPGQPLRYVGDVFHPAEYDLYSPTYLKLFDTSKWEDLGFKQLVFLCDDPDDEKMNPTHKDKVRGEVTIGGDGDEDDLVLAIPPLRQPTNASTKRVYAKNQSGTTMALQFISDKFIRVIVPKEMLSRSAPASWPKYITFSGIRRDDADYEDCSDDDDKYMRGYDDRWMDGYDSDDKYMYGYDSDTWF